MSGFTEELRAGIAAAIANNATAEIEFLWQPDGTAYPDGSNGIYMETQPSMSAVSIVINDYTVDDSEPESIVGIQFRIRGTGDHRVTNAVKDDLFDLFHDQHGGTLGTVKVVMVERRSGATLGQDGSGRVSRTENYYFTVHRPIKNRT